jgi:hypothetical protein
MTTNILPPLVQWANAGFQNTALGNQGLFNNSGQYACNTAAIGSSGQVLQSIGFSAQEVGPIYAFRDPQPSNIIFNAGHGSQEMLRITEDGFYVRGVKVEQDEKEAAAVYKAFKRWMAENELRRPW